MYLENKVILFLTMFIFQFTLLTISHIKNNRVKINDITRRSILSSMYTIIIYSIYTDIHQQNISLYPLSKVYDNEATIINAFIIICLTIIKMIEFTISTEKVN